jgi:hypothetical protein
MADVRFEPVVPETAPVADLSEVLIEMTRERLESMSDDEFDRFLASLPGGLPCTDIESIEHDRLMEALWYLCHVNYKD